ncbi:MAG: cytochrome b6-f complex subunit PetG [Synechococcus sp.]
MIEPLLLGIVLGMVLVTLTVLFVASNTQYRRSNTYGL